MKIVFVNRFFYPDYSATSQLLGDLAFYLSNSDKKITVVTSRQRYRDPVAKLPTSEIIKNVQIYRIWTARFGRGNLLGRTIDYLTFYIVAGYRLFVLLNRGDIVVVKTDPPLISVVVSIIARLCGVKHVNWIQDLFPEIAQTLRVRGITPWAYQFLRWLRNESLRSATTNVVLSARMANVLLREGVPKNRIRVIHNWADDLKYFNHGTQDNEMRKKWGLEDKFVIGYSGNIGRAHEFETLLDAAELLVKKTKFIFLFIGDGAQLEWIKYQKKQRRLSNIQFQPYQPRRLLSRSLSVSDVHIVSLKPELEGLIVPSKFYGIIAAGRAVIFIGDPNGEIAEILKEEECGIAIAPGEGQRLADFLEKLEEDRKICHALGQNARSVFMKKFNKDLSFSAWKEVLEFETN